MYLDFFDSNPYGTNCWLLGGPDSPDALVVDPGFEPPAIHDLCRAAGRRPVAVLLTHAHLDHAGAAGTFAGADLPVYIHGADAVAFSDPEAWGAGFTNPLAPVEDLRELADGQVLSFAGFSVQVMHTPGHTPGHCVFVTDGLVMSGDLVMAGTIGRSDFDNSDPVSMADSLRRFMTLADELPILPGHGPRTSVGRERATNPFLMEPARWS
jgi:hydroxyacylglutathione hydrolase